MENNKDVKMKRQKTKKQKRTVFSTSEVIILVIITLLIGLTIGRLLNGSRIASKFIKSNDKYINTFVKNYEYIVNNYYKEIDKEELINSAISGMMDSLDDPYSVYFDENESDNFNITLDGSYKGIGIQISKDQDTGYMLVTAVFKNSPADASGIKAGDKIVSINGESAASLSANEFSLKVRNSTDKVFKLTIIRDEKEINIELNKDTVVLDSVLSKTYDIEGKKVGYIYIGIFANNTYKQFKKELEELESKNIDALIIDVRSNTGGHLTAVDNILDLFLNSKQIMYQFEQSGKVTSIYGKGKDNKKYEIVLLGNELSASASEVLIAGLRENLGCKFIGKKTYGKGTVQELVDLTEGAQYKLTVKKWLTPKGNWINETEGIEPDIEVDLEEEYYNSGDEKYDTQLNKAFEYLKNN